MMEIQKKVQQLLYNKNVKSKIQIASFQQLLGCPKQKIKKKEMPKQKKKKQHGIVFQ